MKALTMVLIFLFVSVASFAETIPYRHQYYMALSQTQQFNQDLQSRDEREHLLSLIKKIKSDHRIETIVRQNNANQLKLLRRRLAELNTQIKN